ncbi:MAG: hypothetical protein QNJ41_21385 [Xenococcaceae cyanobacterium MO_188.B32]|nr:hypothetical protein [Xenococcaceae cyanobacterium MO_188.B32]
MTTKPLFLDRNLNFVGYSWSFWSVLAINTWLLLSLGGFFPLFLSTPALAESRPTISEQLPPPPPISPRSRRTRTRRYHLRQRTELEPPTNSLSNRSREYTFSAPNTNSSLVNTNPSYKVEVFGNSDALLDRVRNIEPRAFRKGGVIQAGIFQDQKNAEELVRRLTIQGLWSRIISNY